MLVQLVAVHQRRDELADVSPEVELVGEVSEGAARARIAGHRLEDQVGREAALRRISAAPLRRELRVGEGVRRVVEAAVLLLEQRMQSQRVDRRLAASAPPKLGGLCRRPPLLPPHERVELLLTSSASASSMLM